MSDRLTYDMVARTRVLARDRKAGRVLLGGLGVLGIGEMWFVDGPDMRTLAGYEDAPERQWTGGMWP